MSNSKSYNFNSCLFGKYFDEGQEKEQEQDSGWQLVRSSPWQTVQSGHSNVSSPGTSSRSSTNSHGYGQSTDDLSLDSLINSLLQVVNSATFSGLSSPQFCSTRSPSKCRECSDNFICDSCFINKNFNSVDTAHENEYNSLRSILNDMPNSSIINSQSVGLSLFCDVHRDTQRFYCQTCSSPLCRECGNQNRHHGHSTVTLLEAIESAGLQASQVLKEARLGISCLRDELDAVQAAAEILEQKASQATTDVMLCIRRVVTALENREKELIGKIEKARLLKYSALKTKDEGIRSGIIRLSRAADKLSEALEAKMSTNPLSLLLIKDRALSEVFQIRQCRQAFSAQEENWISFNSLETTIMTTIANFGAVVLNNPGPIGDRRAVRGRGISPQTFFSKAITMARDPVPRGRPIPANSFPVVVRINRNPDVPVRSSSIIGNIGKEEDVLCRPWGVACDKDGNIIVADRSNNRIQIYRQDGSLVRRFGSHGSAPGQFDRPAGVAVDARSRIIVADKDNHRIQVVTMEGLFLLSFGEKGCRCGQFNYPWDVAVNSECQIVVSDTRNHRIQLFSPEGVFLKKYGYEATPNMWKHFDSPRGVAFNIDGNIVTTDFNNHRVVIIDADFVHARVFDCESTNGPKQFLRPQGLVIDDEGNFIIADSRNHRIQVFNANGMLKWKFGSFGKSDDEMDRPSGISLCPDGRIAVVDFGNNRVLII